MAGRQSRISAVRASTTTQASSSASSRPKSNKRRKDRNLQAYSIAEKTNPDKVNVRKYRLGEVEDDEPRRKRQRKEDSDEEEREDSAPKPKPKHKLDDDLHGEDGSDSDGNVWRTGTIDADDDTDVDSDEAFGESDEEKFEDFAFRGSSTGNKQNGRKRTNEVKKSSEAFDLNERSEEEGADDDATDGDFGDEGIDLAAMLDDEESEAETTTKTKSTANRKGSAEDNDPFADFDSAEPLMDDRNGTSDDNAPSEYSDEDGDGQFEMSDNEGEEDDAEKQKQLEQMIHSLSKGHGTEENTNGQPGDRNQMLARALAALKTSSGTDPTFSRQVQKLSKSFEPSAKEGKKSVLVSAPLPKRQQDRIERTAARGETNKTLDRWIDTVKHNRRAENLTFPLADPHARNAQNTTQLASTANGKPHNELEANIANILKVSGLGAAGGQAEEKQLQDSEDLQMNKMPLEEVMARRAELRRQRDLMFREEIKAKRIKKIKSKAYRRVHRKDAAKTAQNERALMSAAGFDLSDDERKLNDQKRAEERMGGRHRESRWAKAVKQTGRAAWDDDARDGVTELARRNEELRRRVTGQAEEASEEDSDMSSDSETYGLYEDEDVERERLTRQIGRLEDKGMETETVTGLGALKFMQRAEAVKRQENEENLRRLKKDLVSDNSQAESEEEEPHDTTIGRKMFGPPEGRSETKITPVQRGEFEEGQSSDVEEMFSRQVDATELTEDLAGSALKAAPNGRVAAPSKARKLVPPRPEKAFEPDKITLKARKSKVEAPPEAIESHAPNTNGWTNVAFSNDAVSAEINDDELSDDERKLFNPIAQTNYELVQAAFAGDDVSAAFEAEKAAAAESEDEKITDTALPGWGSWAGEGISKREKKRIAERTKGKFLVKTADGVKPELRKDRKLEKVIISEKKSKKNARYLANALPHPFESRVQYERGIRQPIGPEWTTKETFQAATKPRVLVKPGRAIQPMSMPML